MLFVLLKAEPVIINGSEFAPPVVVAVPIAGRISLPPTLMAVVPICERIESETAFDALNNGIVLAVPPEVVTSMGVGAAEFAASELGAAAPELAGGSPLEEELTPLAGGAASTKAEGGSPPKVCASPAFSA